MKVSDYVAQRLRHWGLDTCFAVTGGGAMHLNDSFGAVGDWDLRYMHHEQACAMAAEGFARVAGRPAVLNVTSGPGSINALNGVFGAFTDSVPMVVVAGQVRRDTNADLAGLSDLRQLGDQEARVLDMVRPITVWCAAVNDPADIVQLLDDAVLAAITPRSGPVWLEVPVDVQGADVPGLNPTLPLPRPPDNATHGEHDVQEILRLLADSKRPLILAGTGIRSSRCESLLPLLSRVLGVPVATAWTHDTVASDDPCYVGRPGTIGTRAGNFVLQSADLVLVLGSRLNVRQVSYNWGEFAPGATIIWVDIDPAELNKPYLKPGLPVVADLANLVPALLTAAETHQAPDREAWWQWCREVRAEFEPVVGDYQQRTEGINAYHLIAALSELMTPSHIVVCGDATACIVPFQVMQVREGMRLFSNSGCASMGYDLPAALGASVAGPQRRVVALAGDGSIMMNLQELQTLRSWAPDLLVLVLDNGGYLSIKQTQSNFFGREFGASERSGVSFPDFARVAEAFDLPVTRLGPAGDWRAQLAEVVTAVGPRVCVAPLDQVQEFEPRLRSRMVDGVIRTPALDDMYPHLPDEVLVQVRSSARGH